jgi:hypothetical protein
VIGVKRFVTLGDSKLKQRTQWIYRVLVRDLQPYLAEDWMECSRERSQVYSLQADETLIEFWNDGERPPMPMEGK